MRSCECSCASTFALVALGLPLDRIPPLLDTVDGSVAAELASLEDAIRQQIVELTRQLDVVVAARASVLPEAPAGCGETNPYDEAADEARAALATVTCGGSRPTSRC